MIVYVVLSCVSMEGCQLLGIFSTRANAQTYIDKLEEWEKWDCDIDKVVVDSELADQVVIE